MPDALKFNSLCIDIRAIPRILSHQSHFISWITHFLILAGSAFYQIWLGRNAHNHYIHQINVDNIKSLTICAPFKKNLYIVFVVFSLSYYVILLFLFEAGGYYHLVLLEKNKVFSQNKRECECCVIIDEYWQQLQRVVLQFDEVYFAKPPLPLSIHS